MKSWKSPRRAFSLNRAGMCILLLILVAGLGSPSFAQVETGPSAAPSGSAATSTGGSYSIDHYVPRGYTKEGPILVVAVTADLLTLFNGREDRPIRLSLKGKKVSVRNELNREISFSEIRKGVPIYVCRKRGGDEMIIFVLRKKEVRNDQ